MSGENIFKPSEDNIVPALLGSLITYNYNVK